MQQSITNAGYEVVLRHYRLMAAVVFILVTATLAAPRTADSAPMVVAGDYHSVALKSDGTVQTWGRNNFGQLGDGTRTNRLGWVSVPGLTGIVSVAAGLNYSVALKSDGTVMAWGNNELGQLGDGTTVNRLTPVAVSGLTGVIAIAAGEFHTLALKSDGTMVAWGRNDMGQLGDGTTWDRWTPVAVAGLTGVTAITAGQYCSLALKSDGTLMGWGYNGWRQLGDDMPQRSSPTAVSGVSGVAAVAAGWDHIVALKTDGTVMTWGGNRTGQLGDGTTADTRTAPMTVPGLTGVAAVGAGRAHSVAVKSDGTVLAWGANNFGGLGDGTTVDRLSPVAVSGLTGVVMAAAGGLHTMALKGDGTIMAWGYNIYGQAGDGTVINRLSPVAVLESGGAELPVLSYSTAAGYGTSGVSPATGSTSTDLTFKVVYTHPSNTEPDPIFVCIDASPCRNMFRDQWAAAALSDGSYANGEQFVFITPLAAGTHTYYFTATGGTITRNLPASGSLSGPTISNLAISSSVLANGTVGSTYSQTLAATGGTAPYTWAGTPPYYSLAPGLSLDPSTGVISGTPTIDGIFSFGVAVTDAASVVVTKGLSITIEASPDTIPPTVPGGLSATVVTPTQINLSWSASTDNTGVTSYKVYRNSVLLATLGNVLSYNNTGLTGGVTYSYTVQACDAAANCSAQSTAASATTPAGSPDLVMSAVSTTATSAHVGSMIPVANTVTNIGNLTSASTSVKFYLSTDATITTSDIAMTASRSVPSLAAGQSSSATTSATIPKTTAPGVYYVGACVTEPVAYTDASNCLAASTTISVIRNVDLVIDVPSPPPFPPPPIPNVPIGGSFPVTYTLNNLGTTAMTAASITVGFYLSADSAIATSDIPLTGRGFATPLLPGGSSSRTVTVTVPKTTVPGWYYVGACADITNVQPEINETNNCGSVTSPVMINVYRDVDLVMAAVSSTATSVNIGNTFVIDNTEQNQGTTVMSASNNTIKFYLSADNVITTSDLALTGSRVVSSLAAGASSTGATTVTVPKTTPPGTYFIGAFADATNVQPETNENNNGLAGGTITVVRNVDLIMSAVSTTTTSAARGTAFAIDNTETNQGATWMSATSSTVKFYLSLDNVITTSDIALTGTRSVAALAAGASSSASTTVTVPLTVSPGTYYVGVIADVTNMQPETNEANNALASGATIVIPGPADTTPPTVPNVSATAVSSSQINLFWPASSDDIGVRRYEIYRSSGCPVGQVCTFFSGPQLIQTLTGSPPVNGYNNTGLAANTNYVYFVRACDAANNCSTMSSGANAATLP